MTKKRLVIIGGGFAGARIAKKLQKIFATTLIDTKDYFEYTPGVLRALVQPRHATKLQVLHKKYLRYATIVHASVQEVTPTHVIAHNKKYFYDYLVIASGASYTLPFKQKNVLLAQRAQTLVDQHKNIERAKKILVVGGGIVGVELSAELRHFYPNKKITLVHSREELIPRCSEKTRQHVNKYMHKHEVELILGERIKKADNDEFITDKKTIIHADIVFMSTGIIPNSEYLQGFAALDERGFVKVEPTLQLLGTTNVFVAGDITGIKEEKLAQNAHKHASVIVDNLKRLENNYSLREYQRTTCPTLLSLGPYDGSFCYKKIHLNGLLAGLLKTIIEKLTLQQYK